MVWSLKAKKKRKNEGTKGVGRAGESARIPLSIWSSYSLCSDDVGTSSAGTCVFCRRSNGMPPLFFDAKLGHSVGCTMLMQSVCAFALQPRHRTPCRLWPRNTWPHASQGVILRYVYSRQVCPPSDSRLFLKYQRSSLSLSPFSLRTRAVYNRRRQWTFEQLTWTWRRRWRLRGTWSPAFLFVSRAKRKTVSTVIRNSFLISII